MPNGKWPACLLQHDLQSALLYYSTVQIGLFLEHSRQPSTPTEQFRTSCTAEGRGSHPSIGHYKAKIPDVPFRESSHNTLEMARPRSDQFGIEIPMRVTNAVTLQHPDERRVQSQLVHRTTDTAARASLRMPQYAHAGVIGAKRDLIHIAKTKLFTGRSSDPKLKSMRLNGSFLHRELRQTLIPNHGIRRHSSLGARVPHHNQPPQVELRAVAPSRITSNCPSGKTGTFLASNCPAARLASSKSNEQSI
ncbi:hypothetical protein CRG98_001131 [Punica granatum]|uniref:Uncharacterized protein n=1 Tax=Punica granatum TaxID=22663 RepID=A0A2I0LCT5_PUNGR|nr:hypothetical protein CRG98_001131 [Punica granatum]